jgi:hypothetical protein
VGLFSGPKMHVTLGDFCNHLGIYGRFYLKSRESKGPKTETFVFKNKNKQDQLKSK